MCPTERTLDCKKKTSTSPTRRERPLIRKTGWRTPERERETDREEARERRRDKKMLEQNNIGRQVSPLFSNILNIVTYHRDDSRIKILSHF